MHIVPLENHFILSTNTELKSYPQTLSSITIYLTWKHTYVHKIFISNTHNIPILKITCIFPQSVYKLCYLHIIQYFTAMQMHKVHKKLLHDFIYITFRKQAKLQYLACGRTKLMCETDSRTVSVGCLWRKGRVWRKTSKSSEHSILEPCDGRLCDKSLNCTC